MIQEYKQEIGQIVGELQCPTDPERYNPPEFDVLCKARDAGEHTFVECLEKSSDNCPFSLSLTGLHYCKCPVCSFIVKHRIALQEITRDLSCPKGFQCYKSGFQDLCKVRDVGMQTFVECHEQYSEDCTFSLSLYGWNYCRCPVRVYVVKNLKR
ncbi:MAG: hypothetical protein ABUK14_09155 [Desulfobacteria bacterium]